MKELVWHDLQWCLKRCPAKLLELLKAHPLELFVAGGFVRACIANEIPSDIDVFSPSKEMARKAAQELIDKYATGDALLHATDNAFTVYGAALKLSVQFIHRWTFTHPARAIESFDFTIAQAAFWSDTDRWMSVCAQDFYPDLAAKRLIYTSPRRIEEVGGSMLRVLKFYQRGYRIPLNSLGLVISRLVSGVDFEHLPGLREKEGPITKEEAVGRVLSELLREVDPNIDPNHIAHLPSEGDSQ